MKPILFVIALCGGIVLFPQTASACSVLYYVDPESGHIYVVNNEDYWYDVDAYIQIEPRNKKKYARLWYGWDNFAQGGINEKGLFFDGAVTPEQQTIQGYTDPQNNLGDKILAECATVYEAIAFLEKEKIALSQSHIMFGDKSGKAVVVEWIEGEKRLHWRTENQLIMTNYLLEKPEAGNYPCPRYESISERVAQLENSDEKIELRSIGNTVGQAVQLPQEWEKDRMGGTLYTTFMDVTEGKFVLSYQLSNENIVQLDLTEVFEKSRKRKIKLEK